MSAPLVVENVSVERGGTRVLSHVTFTLHPGELCALIGPSGAGKSTLIKVLLGLYEPKDGRVHQGGQRPAERGPTGYVPQDDALHATLTVERELDYAAQLRLPDATPDERAARVDAVMRAVGVDERRALRIASLSGGQRKRVSVALELLTEPDLLILDEPTSGLDPGLEARSMKLFADVARGGRVVLVATHAMESLEACDALIVLVRGHVAYFGPPKDALGFFRVERFASLFDKLPLQSPAAWHKAALAWPGRASFLARTGARAATTNAERAPPPPSATAAPATEPPSVDDALVALKAKMGLTERGEG